MATFVPFTGTSLATSAAEVFWGRGPSDTVSYDLVQTGLDIGDYTLGVIASLEAGAGFFGWAMGDLYISVENLTGSQHTDFLTGNDADNTLNGGGSPDFLYGHEGNDAVLGGGGFDFGWGEGGDDLMNGQDQTDRMYGGDGNDQIWGGANFTKLEERDPNTDYRDHLYGEAGDDDLHGDVLLPAADSPSEYNEAGDHMPGADVLYGGLGSDTLNGDGGNDGLWGEDDADTFVFDAPYTVKQVSDADLLITSGNDVIYDFQQGEDLIDLRGFSDISSFGDLNIRTADADNDGGVDDSIIQFDAANSVAVHNIILAASDFASFI